MRKLLLLSIVLITGVVFTGRLFYLQIYDTSFQKLSEGNAIKVIYDYPEFISILKRARAYSPRHPSVVIPQLNKSEYAYLSEKMHKYGGFYIQKRSLRDYQVKHSANVLGYIAEVNNKIIDKNPYYKMGDLIGSQGIELQYEEVLRGVKGVKYIQKDRFNRDIGPYKDGKFDTLPDRGKDITLTIDATLQQYGEELMINKRGGIVALEPATGEILALISAPSYDPGLLVGRERSKNFNKLWYDTIAKPLFDRGLSGEYPPGSPFKTLTALIGLQEGVINTKETIYCNEGYVYGRGKKLGCHHHRTPLEMIGGIANSCNAYFCTVYRRTIEKYPTPQEGIDAWNTHLKSFGLGDYMGYDLPSGRKGFIPNSDYYNRSYNYPTYKWYATATISNAIGQGEVLLTPVQMVNFTAAIANRGWFYRPHIIKNIGDVDTIPGIYKIKNKTTIDPSHFDPVVEGMFDVYNKGTAAHIQIPGIEICGKTGTAENYIRIEGKRIQLTDHSIFVAFAPKDDPKIAIAVFVENGFWGSRWAGRIAGLMIEKYIKGEITRTDMESFVLNGSLEEEYAKPFSGTPFNINN